VSAVAPARQCAYTVIRRVFESGAFADRALHAEAAGLDARDRALAMTLAYGTVQRCRTLDHVLARLSSRAPERLDPPVLASLRLGLFQLLYLDGVARHAAVNESVELVKQTGRGGAQLVNAVLRRAGREGPALVAQLRDGTADEAAIAHSVPDWIAQLWFDELGAGEARALLREINEPAESALRINALRAELELALPVGNVPAGLELPEGRVLTEPFDAFGSALWQDGLIAPQSRASMLVARALAPRAGERVLDLCAAPGSKTTHLAALMGGEGELVAVEVHPGRAQALRATCARMGAGNVRVLTADGRSPELVRELTNSTAQADPGFDRVLVDPPCSGLGTLQSRPDLRWQERRSRLGELTTKQLELLWAGARFVRPGGTLVYSVCTISRAEGEGVVERFLAGAESAGAAGFDLEDSRMLLPHRDRTDGFCVLRLSRR
jgi:16S rRNA (cytosine967-C5)-methyltransferase